MDYKQTYINLAWYSRSKYWSWRVGWRK